MYLRLYSMKHIFSFLLIFIIAAGFQGAERDKAGSGGITIEVSLSEEEMKLYNQINAYRKYKRLRPVPLSKCLTYVAQEHSRDLMNKKPDSKGNCNMHSWSESERWTACCYTPDHKKAECMWNKPKELTSYQDHGFEISYFNSDPQNLADKALAGWKKSTPHNNTILNKEQWAKLEWKAIGVGISGGYAIVWFGKTEDKEGPPSKK